MATTSTQTIGRKDHISLLPDCLIHLIFSFLTMGDVVKTCVLSKRWQSAWTNVSDLRFSISSYDDPLVDKVLRRYMCRKVKKFHLDIKQDNYHSNIDSWVHFAIDHQVEDLLLKLDIRWWDIWWEGYNLSPLLNSCSSLTKLCLRGCRFSCSDSITCSSLKSLTIQNVNNDMLQKIMMGSPLLEYLNLIGCWKLKRIQSRSLRELVIDSPVVESSLEIWTPRLLSLRVRVDLFNEMITIIEAPSLVESELDFDSPAKLDRSRLEEMFCKLQNATRIVFGAWYLRVTWPLKVEDMPISLLNCKSLTLHMPVRQFSFPAIANMLATTSILEKLVIIIKPSDWGFLWYRYDLDSRNVDHESYWLINKEFKHWAQHLKNVEIFGFYSCLKFKYEEVLTLVKFLLEHGSVLENLVIKVKNPKSKQDLGVVRSHKLLEVAQRLQRYHRVSKHVTVSFNYQVEGHEKQHKEIE